MKKRIRKMLTTSLAVVTMVSAVNSFCVFAGEALEFQEGLLPTDEEEFIAHLSRNYTMGDINKDYGVTLKDATAVLKSALKITPMETVCQEFVADVNGDGSVSLEDASKILKMALKIDAVKSLSSVSKAEGNTRAFIEEVSAVSENAMTILSTEEELEKYISNCSVENGKKTLEAYKHIFEEQNLLAVRVRVYSNQLSDLNFYTVLNGNHVLVQVIENEIQATDKNYEMFLFVCVDKKLTKDTAVLSMDSREVNNQTDIIAVQGNGKETADYTEATSHVHMLRNEEELQIWKNFLKDSYQVNLEETFLREYLSQMDEEHFYTHAYVALTYCKPSGSFSYEVTKMEMDKSNGILKLELKYIDENESDVPGEKDGLNCVFVKVPVRVLDNVSEVELEVVTE